jgi:hypothetical protein
LNIDSKAGIDDDTGPNALLHANATASFESGGYNDGVNQTFELDKFMSHEIASKNQFFGHKISDQSRLPSLQYRELQVIGRSTLRDLKHRQKHSTLAAQHLTARI